MKWLSYVLVAYVAFVFFALNAIPVIIHKTASRLMDIPDGTHRYRAEVFWERRVQFGPGHGRHIPGFVRLSDRYGNNLGERELDDILSVGQFTWNADSLQFEFLRDGERYRTTLPLPQ